MKNERHLNEETYVTIETQNERIKRTEDNVYIQKKDKNSNKYIPISYPEVEIENTILPTSVKDFFLFKGEFLDSFFENQNKNFLKDTVLNVSQITKLQKVIEILNNLENKYRKEIAKADRKSAELIKVQREIEEFGETIKILKERIIKLDGKLFTYKTEIKQIEGILVDKNVRQLTELLTEEKQLKGQKESLIADKNGIREEIKEKFVNELSFWFLFEVAKNFKKTLNKMEESGKIPPPATPSLIHKILEEKKCICGNSVNVQMKARLEMLLQNLSRDSTKYDELYRINLTLSIDINEFQLISKKIQSLLGKQSEKEQELTQTVKRLEEISEKIKGVSESDAPKLQVQKETLESEISKLEAEKVEVLSDLATNEKNKMYYEILFTKEVDRSGKNEFLVKKLEVINVFRTKINNISIKILNKIVEELNNNTKAYFKDIFWDNYKYMNYDIKINENLNLEVSSPRGSDMLPLLSTGEKKVLALSFISALSDFYGFDFPIIIDSPFTALQKEIIENVLKTLMKLATKKQVIIFTIRYEDKIMNQLIKNASIVYNLEKDKNDNTILKKVK